MSNITALMGMGEMRRRQEAAKRRGEKYQVAPEVRVARARMLAEREALNVQAEADVQAERVARPDAVRAILQHASIDELTDFARVTGQIDGRRLAVIVADVIRHRQRHSPAASQESQEAVLAGGPSLLSRRL